MVCFLIKKLFDSFILKMGIHILDKLANISKRDLICKCWVNAYIIVGKFAKKVPANRVEWPNTSTEQRTNCFHIALDKKLYSTYLACFMLNSLWPSDAIWRQRSGSTLAQAMACCLTAPSHYLNQMLTDHQWSPMTFIFGQFHKKCLNHESLKSVWKLHT